MTEELGFDKERFTNYQADNFDCPICSGVAKMPKDCNKCGTIFCASCIDSWLKKKNECPNRCKDFAINPITRALKRIYDDLELKCQFCQKPQKVSEIDKHESVCRQPKCVNFEVCGKAIASSKDLQDQKVCDQTCLLLAKVKNLKSKAEIYAIVKQYINDKQLS